MGNTTCPAYRIRAEILESPGQVITTANPPDVEGDTYFGPAQLRLSYPTGEISANTTYYWEVVPYNSTGESIGASVWLFSTAAPPTYNIDETSLISPGEESTLGNAFPNPFSVRGFTHIQVKVKAGESGILTIYNLRGQVVRTAAYSGGTYQFCWSGKGCNAGVYLCQLRTTSTFVTRKLVIVN